MMGNGKEQPRRGVGKRKQKKQIEKRKDRVLSGEVKPDFLISMCKIFFLDYLSLGSFRLFFCIILFSSSTSLGPYFASFALTE